jgi:glyoxylase-like metal-dependent hydrolase (beta-lactamase superfamily II)
MHHRRARAWTRPLGAACLASVAALPPAGADEPFRVDVLADGVHLFRPADASPERANSLVVERDDGLLVVDAQPTPEAARELLAQIAERVAGPVRYLVLSHPHAEAAGGATAFPDSVLVLAANRCRQALQDPAHDFGAEMRLRAETPAAYEEPDRPAVSLVIHGKIELPDGRNPVHVTALSPTHSPGDVLVTLPGPQIAHAGGIVFMDRNPYVAAGEVASWIRELNGLLRQRIALAVGMRGPAATTEDLRAQRDSLAWIEGHANHARIGRPPLEEVRARLLALPGLAERFDTEASPSFVEILVDSLLRIP